MRVVHVGFGPIGQSIYNLVRDRPGLTSTGIVDLDLQRVQQQLESDPAAPPVVDSLDRLEPGSADVVVLCTGSRLATVAGQVRAALEFGASVISTCEELSYPWRFNADLAGDIDAAARSAGKVVLSTGVNPGFIMDALPTLVSSVVPRVTQVRVRRVVDAAQRRKPLQAKVGVGITQDAFDELKRNRSIGHVGLVESVAMLADGLGLGVDQIGTDLQPVVADQDTPVDGTLVKAGDVLGIHEIATGSSDGQALIQLDLTMVANAKDPGDHLELDGQAPIRVTLQGVHGDVATAAITVRFIPALAAMQPGLRTMLDVLNLTPTM